MIKFGKTSHWQINCIRKLFVTDTPEYQAHLLRLGQGCRYSRFGAFMSNAILMDHARQCFKEKSLIFAYIENGMIRGAAELILFDAETERCAEIALSVEENWRRQGIGSALFEKLIIAASNRDISRMIMQCLPENQAMQNLALQFQAKIRFDHEERVGTITNLHPTVFSLAQEATDDWCSIIEAFTHIQQGIWSPEPPANSVTKLSA